LICPHFTKGAEEAYVWIFFVDVHIIWTGTTTRYAFTFSKATRRTRRVGGRDNHPLITRKELGLHFAGVLGLELCLGIEVRISRILIGRRIDRSRRRSSWSGSIGSRRLSLRGRRRGRTAPGVPTLPGDMTGTETTATDTVEVTSLAVVA